MFNESVDSLRCKSDVCMHVCMYVCMSNLMLFRTVALPAI